MNMYGEESRIKLKDNTMDVVVKMSEGNPGAMTCLCEMISKKDWTAGTPGLLVILSLDTLGLYGSKIYMLWNDCCSRDLDKLDLVLLNWQRGNLSREAIHENLSQGYGTPFENLKTVEELNKELDNRLGSEKGD